MDQQETKRPLRSVATRLFGRRKGRPLNAHKTSLMDGLLPRLAVPVPEAGKKIDLTALFGGTLPPEIWFEVGFGGGEHLLEQAQRHPDFGLIGCEPFLNGVASLLSAIEREGVQNIRLHANDARTILDALPDACLARAFVQYPDPWPKTRHADRRFIGPENLDRLARVLRPGGQLRLATDVEDLAAWMRSKTTAHPAFTCIHDSREPPEDWVRTRYEKKGLAAGRYPTYLLFRRV